jgi:hypothetical protein
VRNMSQSLESYSELEALLKSVVDGGEEAELELASSAEANTLRLQLYVYRRLLRKEGLSKEYEKLQFCISKDRPNVILFKTAPVIGIRAKLKRLGRPLENKSALLDLEEKEYRAKGFSEEAIKAWREEQEKVGGDSLV